VDAERLRSTLERAVRTVCPTWLSSQRDDLVQKACLRIVKKSAEGEEPDSLGTSYLWKVAHSVVMDEIRHRRRRPETDLDSLGAATEDRASSADLRDAIQQGVEQLAEPRRWVVLLYLYGYSLKDSAGILGWNSKRVDNQRYKGLTELRSYLRERGHEP
jgi:RNA polymerase sigma factor (sigma-70 family)